MNSRKFRKNYRYFTRLALFFGTAVVLILGAYNGCFHSSREVTLVNKLTSYFVNKGTKNEQNLAKPENSNLWRRLNILCIVHTCPENLETKTKYVKEVWTYLCNKTLFVSDENDDTFPTIKVTNKTGYREIWAKSRNALELVYSKYLNKFDWFFKADDDTYVVMDNLRRFLYKKNSSKLKWYGKVMINGYQGGYYPQGGAGYAFGRAALKRLVEVGFKKRPNCPNITWSTHSDDVWLGVCLNESGITLVKDCYDSQGRELFHPTNLRNEYFLPWNKRFPYYRHSYNKTATEKCCSSESISFHKVKGAEQIFTDFIMRRLFS